MTGLEELEKYMTLDNLITMFEKIRKMMQAHTEETIQIMKAQSEEVQRRHLGTNGAQNCVGNIMSWRSKKRKKKRKDQDL